MMQDLATLALELYLHALELLEAHYEAKHKTAARKAPRTIIAPEKQALLQPLLDQMVSFLSGERSAKIGELDSQVLEVLQAKKKPQELPSEKMPS